MNLKIIVKIEQKSNSMKIIIIEFCGMWANTNPIDTADDAILDALRLYLITK